MNSFWLYVGSFWLILAVVRSVVNKLRLRGGRNRSRGDYDNDDPEELKPLRIGVGRISLETDKLNGFFSRVGGNRRRRYLWKGFFAIGVIFTCFCIIPSTIMLLVTLIRHLLDMGEKLRFNPSADEVASAPMRTSQAVEAVGEVVSKAPATIIPPQMQYRRSSAWTELSKWTRSMPRLVAVVPGVNVGFIVFDYFRRLFFHSQLDATSMPWYFLSFLMCTVIHEAGHAISAVSEGITVLTVGCAFIWCFPIAFVNLDLRDEISASKRLRTICAGEFWVWIRREDLGITLWKFRQRLFEMFE